MMFGKASREIDDLRRELEWVEELRKYDRETLVLLMDYLDVERTAGKPAKPAIQRKKEASKL